MALIATLAEFKARLRRDDITDDAKLTDILTAASEWVEWRIGGPLAVTPFTERLRTNGWAFQPGYAPLVSVTSITSELAGATALDASWYTVDTTANLVRMVWGVPAGWYLMVYSAGLSAIPKRTKLAGLEVADHLWLVQNGSAGRGYPDEDTVPTPMGFAVPRRAEEMLEPRPVYGFA